MSTLEDLKADLDAFEACCENLEANHGGQFVVFHDASFEGAHRSLHVAAKDAVDRFGDAPFLIRQVGAEREISLPFVLPSDSHDASRLRDVRGRERFPGPRRAHSPLAEPRHPRRAPFAVRRARPRGYRRAP